jgi:hypothetical protein
MCHTLLKPLALGLGLVVLALLWLGSGAPPAARAALAQGLGQAGPTCMVCLDGGCDYATIQAAVDDAGCTEIRVAQGVYSGVQARPIPAGYPSPPASGLITQVVYISRTVTVRGGYTTTNWTTPDPIAQPTTLDANRLGRVMVIAGDISPTIEGLGMTNGFAPGLISDPIGNGGGGAYVLSATATFSACHVFGNMADAGGGLYLDHSPATLIANRVISNFAYDGGGVLLDYSPATLISSNVASNTAAIGGGGLHLWLSSATLISNSVVANSSYSCGGGLVLFLSDATLSANSIVANTASEDGGGLCLDHSNAMLTNTIVADNRVSAHGSGLYVDWASTLRLLHTTIARNGGGADSGLYVGGTATAWLTNTILFSQSAGIIVAEGGTAIMNGTLWHDNGANWGGAGTLAHSGDYTGNPAFVGPEGGDYHIPWARRPSIAEWTLA